MIPSVLKKYNRTLSNGNQMNTKTGYLLSECRKFRKEVMTKDTKPVQSRCCTGLVSSIK